MRIALIDVDSKIPNLALMKASAWHKARGDEVKLYEPLFDNPDLAYASKIFEFTPDYPYMPGCEVLRGGPGYDRKATLPFPDADRIMPDYELFGCSYAIGRMTRGCPNRCPWCVVPGMDGNEVHRVAKLTDFWCGQDTVRLLDDNIMADEDIFVDACRELHDARVKVIWEALDIRLVTNRSARALASVKQAKSIHFAWDGHSQDDAVHVGIETLKRNGIKPYRLMFYVLVGFNTTRDYDLHRVYELRRLGVNPFVMPYDKSDPYQRALARWCNNKFIFKACQDFWEYEGAKKLREGANAMNGKKRPSDRRAD